jgi:nicotinamidase/pyrazinamidase
MKKALFIVNPQMDFMSGGSLNVPFGDKIIPNINSLIEKFEIVVISKEWHPVDHKSFVTNNEGKNIFEEIIVNGKSMIIWPPHCIQGTEGAKIHPELKIDGFPVFIMGEDTNEHSFSGFSGTIDGLSVEKYLKDKDVDEVFVVGLVGDYCVKETALDSVVSFKTYIIIDATKFIGDITSTLEDLVKNDVIVINCSDFELYYSLN